MADLLENFSLLLDKAIDWASDLEAQVLESGVELTAEQSIDARLAGVKEHARVRVLFAEEIPLPDEPTLAAANQQVRLITPTDSALTLGFGIIIREGYSDLRRLLVHEFVHVAQYERFGGMERFLQEYLTQIIRDGYQGAALENEAAVRTNVILGLEK